MKHLQLFEKYNQTNKRNEHGVKSSDNLYRNIGGVHYEQWTSDPGEFEKAKDEAKSLGLKTKVIKGELFREVKETK